MEKKQSLKVQNNKKAAHIFSSTNVQTKQKEDSDMNNIFTTLQKPVDCKEFHTDEFKNLQIYSSKIGGSHEHKRDWLISDCGQYLLKPKLKDHTFKQELLAFSTLSSSLRYKSLSQIFTPFDGICKVKDTLYLMLENIKYSDYKSSKLTSLVPKAERDFRSPLVSEALIDIKIGHTTMDPFVPIAAKDKTFKTPFGWRFIGFEVGQEKKKFKRQDYCHENDMRVFKECIIRTIEGAENPSARGLERKIANQIINNIKKECEKILELLEKFEEIELISSSLLIYVKCCDDKWSVKVRVIDLAHTYFLKESQRPRSRVFLDGIKGFLEDLGKMGKS